MSEGISYHNKDVLFKFLSELYKDTTLDVFGLQGMSKIKQLLPSNLPKVRANEKRSDTQFLLEDGSILMLEYESNHSIIENHIKYPLTTLKGFWIERIEKAKALNLFILWLSTQAM